MNGCAFCAIVAGDASATVVREWDAALAIVPLGPVVAGHLLVIPKRHVADFGEDPTVSAAIAACAAELVAELPAMNAITSKGRAATQSVGHLHLHIVPRVDSDGLALPWHPGERSGRLS